MNFWTKTIGEMKPLNLLKYVKPSEMVMGIDRTMISVANHAAKNGIAKTVFPTMVAIGTVGVTVEYILCNERHGIAKYV
eukprot:CAMPEP_0114512138 /NCGR_PEP_ID=MMETSP0109-20121206/14800_1 /TAXON_ID=29199 /ORGANISM="Chlorarachnion reptans, Strain CCCM449" /LENGTH=78 /DNA_ID=CAMNT_0001691771 /DNA_START=34 /DNA_END=270 /DNA_ORIENTATION=+